MTRIDISTSPVATAGSAIGYATVPRPISSNWTRMAARKSAGVLCREICSSRATSCWRKRSPWRPTNGPRWRWPGGLRRDGRLLDRRERRRSRRSHVLIEKGLEPDKTGIGPDDDADRNLPQIGFEAPLAFKALA